MFVDVLLHFVTSKVGEDLSQDALSINEEACRFAVADGVSNQTIFSDKFAKFIVDDFVVSKNKESQRIFHDSSKNNINFQCWCDRLSSQWRKKIPKLLKNENVKEVLKKNWYNSRWADCSTFAGVEIKEKNQSNCTLNYMIIGDCYLFLLDESDYPVILSSDNGSDKPDLIKVSFEKNKNQPKEVFLSGQKVIMRETFVILTTDALGRWLKKKSTKNHDIILDMTRFKKNFKFSDWLQEAQHKQGMENDDVAIIILKITPNSS